MTNATHVLNLKCKCKYSGQKYSSHKYFHQLVVVVQVSFNDAAIHSSVNLIIFRSNKSIGVANGKQIQFNNKYITGKPPLTCQI